MKFSFTLVFISTLSISAIAGDDFVEMTKYRDIKKISRKTASKAHGPECKFSFQSSHKKNLSIDAVIEDPILAEHESRGAISFPEMPIKFSISVEKSKTSLIIGKKNFNYSKTNFKGIYLLAKKMPFKLINSYSGAVRTSTQTLPSQELLIDQIQYDCVIR